MGAHVHRGPDHNLPTWSTETTLPTSRYQKDSGRRMRTCKRNANGFLIRSWHHIALSAGLGARCTWEIGDYR